MNNLDILTIDKKIRSYLSQNNKKLTDITEKIESLQEQLNNVPKYSRLYMDLQETIKNETNTQKSLINLSEESFYISETADLITKYRDLLKVPVKASFFGKKQLMNTGEIDRVISTYRKIVKKYEFIFLTELSEKCQKNKLRFRMVCNNCENDRDFVLEDNSYICCNCGSQQERVEYNPSKENERVSSGISVKYSYDKKNHFRDFINQYQGKQNCYIDDKVYEDLRTILKRHHLVQNDDYSKVSKDHIHMFLKELNYTKHYENVNLIHYKITGKKPDDISHLEEKLIQDFGTLVDTYEKYFKGKSSRVSFISTQYVLYQLLLKYKHPCKREDFGMLKTMERKSFHDDICSKLFGKLNWNFTPLY